MKSLRLSDLKSKWMTSYRLINYRAQWRARLRPCAETQPIFVLGCQRSGTTALARMIGLGSEVRRYEEGDPAYFILDDAPRLLDLEMVAKRLVGERNRFTLIKALCESQRANELLDRFPHAQIVWIFRHYSTCIASHVRYYRAEHDAVEYVQDIVNPAASSWKCVGLSRQARARLAEYQHVRLTPKSAYAIYWLARNLLYFNMIKSERVHVVNYEALIEAPQAQGERIFKALGLPYRPHYADLIDNSYERRTRVDGIDPFLTSWCDDTYESLLAELS
jgi:hypothetical protein